MIQGFLRSDLSMSKVVTPESIVNGILFSPADKVLVATDGRCMVIRPIHIYPSELNPGETNITNDIIIPVGTFDALSRIKVTKYAQFLKVCKKDDQYVISCTNKGTDFEVSFSPVDRVFPPYKNILPDKGSFKKFCIHRDQVERMFKTLQQDKDIDLLQFEISNDPAVPVIVYTPGTSGFGIVASISNLLDFEEDLYNSLKGGDNES